MGLLRTTGLACWALSCFGAAAPVEPTKAWTSDVAMEHLERVFNIPDDSDCRSAEWQPHLEKAFNEVFTIAHNMQPKLELPAIKSDNDLSGVLKQFLAINTEKTDEIWGRMQYARAHYNMFDNLYHRANFGSDYRDVTKMELVCGHDSAWRYTDQKLDFWGKPKASNATFEVAGENGELRWWHSRTGLTMKPVHTAIPGSDSPCGLGRGGNGPTAWVVGGATPRHKRLMQLCDGWLDTTAVSAQDSARTGDDSDWRQATTTEAGVILFEQLFQILSLEMRKPIEVKEARSSEDCSPNGEAADDTRAASVLARCAPNEAMFNPFNLVLAAVMSP